LGERRAKGMEGAAQGKVDLWLSTHLRERVRRIGRRGWVGGGSVSERMYVRNAGGRDGREVSGTLTPKDRKEKEITTKPENFHGVYLVQRRRGGWFLGPDKGRR